MTRQSLNAVDAAEDLATDIAIVGGGACGLILARALAASGRDILVLESGSIGQDDDHEALNTVEMDAGCWSAGEAAARDAYHRSLTSHWDGARQAYGVRCRGLGGSTQAWAGKSAPFDAIDFSARPWVPLSGWPLPEAELAPYYAKAAEALNLGPGPFDAGLWDLIGRTPPSPAPQPGPFRTIFWKFARSRRSLTDIMRVGDDFRAAPPTGVRLLTDATATRILTSPDGTAVEGLVVQSLAGRRLTVRTRTIVLAASAIENARLLLVSRDADPRGLGNRHDLVGRYLTDHPTATVATFPASAAPEIAARFGLYGHKVAGQTHVYMHGLSLDPDWQRAHEALNGAVFATEERAADDPFSAVRRLLTRRSESVAKDALSIARSPGRVLRGAMARSIERGHLPEALSRRLVDLSLRYFPNTLARDFQTGRLPVKLTGLRIEATTEQPPLFENRVALSERTDPLGVPLPRVTWRAGEQARENLLRMGQAFCSAMAVPGLPAPTPADWVRDGDPSAAIAIDLGHSMGTTRMSDDPERGVVDATCRVHGVEGLFVAGGSVLPTSGHANPTFTMVALALRLADHLSRR